jgi:glycosyltransferase involved in cell wall biosynthesis
MACGMPIIASAGGETERIINEAGCGICCKVGDEKALCSGIKRMLTEDNDKFGKNSFEYCKTNFSKSKLMDEMDRYLTGII